MLKGHNNWLSARKKWGEETIGNCCFKQYVIDSIALSFFLIVRGRGGEGGGDNVLGKTKVKLTCPFIIFK